MYAITQFKAPIVVLLGSHVHAVKVVHVLESINAFAQLVLVVTIAPPVRLILLLPFSVVLCCAVLCCYFALSLTQSHCRIGLS